MIESRCGIKCGVCPYNVKNDGLNGSSCTGCTNMEKPVWADSCPIKSCCEGKQLEHCGMCVDFPCAQLIEFANDKEHGDQGRRLEQCRAWVQQGACGKEHDSCAGKKDCANMTYETVNLPAKTFAGYSERLTNNSPELPAKIGALWQKFFLDGGAKINAKTGSYVYGLYTNYENDCTGAYDVAVCFEVTPQTKQSAEVKTFTVPAGKYAKFTVSGPMGQAVAEFWQRLWKMDIPRTYTGDFEEYQDGSTMEHGVIHVYIAIK